MNAKVIINLAFLAVFLLTIVGGSWSFNSIIGSKEAVAAAWAQVESSYQREPI